MLVTIFADASWCPKTKVAGWGGWAKSGRGSVFHGGAMKSKCTTAEHAECLAIVNAVALARAAQVAIDGDSLLVQADCLGAISRFAPNRVDKEKFGAAFRSLTETHSVLFRHVKGHRGREDNRAAVNTACDGIARKNMREARWAALKEGDRP